jgi:hypothetical protein
MDVIRLIPLSERQIASRSQPCRRERIGRALPGLPAWFRGTGPPRRLRERRILAETRPIGGGLQRKNAVKVAANASGRRIDKKTTPSYVSQRVRTVIATHACRCIIVLQKPE